MLKHNRHNRWVHTHTCKTCSHVVRSAELRVEDLRTRTIVCPRCKEKQPLHVRLRRAGNIEE